MSADRIMGYILTAPLVLIVGGACLAVALDTLHAIHAMFRRPKEVMSHAGLQPATHAVAGAAHPTNAGKP